MFNLVGKNLATLFLVLKLYFLLFELSFVYINNVAIFLNFIDYTSIT